MSRVEGWSEKESRVEKGGVRRKKRLLEGERVYVCCVRMKKRERDRLILVVEVLSDRVSGRKRGCSMEKEIER